MAVFDVENNEKDVDRTVEEVSSCCTWEPGDWNEKGKTERSGSNLKKGRGCNEWFNIPRVLRVELWSEELLISSGYYVMSCHVT